jgi:hypothetical protein
MIVGNLKPLEEIVSAIKEYKQILVLGCGSCVTVCLSGGEKEAEQLCQELSKVRHYEGGLPEFEMGCILRQCEEDLVREYQAIPDGTDAILSLACGAGVQTVADAHDPLPVIPALNTTFLGASAKPGIWAEMCRPEWQLRSRSGYALRLGDDLLPAQTAEQIAPVGRDTSP